MVPNRTQAASRGDGDRDNGDLHGGPTRRQVLHPEFEQSQAKYLLLVAILVATVTYTAGLDPPGGIWRETRSGHSTGNPILQDTRRVQYMVFYDLNTTAFVVSIIIILLPWRFRKPLRWLVVLDLLLLMAAYIAGISGGQRITIYALVHCTGILFLLLLLLAKYKGTRLEGVGTRSPGGSNVTLGHKEWREFLMLLATFAATITYTAALSPPGGFWENDKAGKGGHHAGDPILLERGAGRLVVFCACNTTAFATSVLIMMLLLSRRFSMNHRLLSLLSGLIAVVLVSLLAAYAAGSLVETDFAFVSLCVAVALAVLVCISLLSRIDLPTSLARIPMGGPVDDARPVILLLAILTVTVTFQAGIDPPGGVWRENGDGHNASDLILLATDTMRFKVFFYFNTVAFVLSIIVILMVQSRSLVSQQALRAAVTLHLFGLTGAYTAGSCPDVPSRIFVCILAITPIIGMVISHVVMRGKPLPQSNLLSEEERKKQLEDEAKKAEEAVGENPRSEEDRKKQLKDEAKKAEDRRQILLFIAVLAVTITYHAGLTPPGKFWLEHGDKLHHVGRPVLADNHPWHYKLFFYYNATSFIISITVIVLLVTHRLPSLHLKYYWLALQFYLAFVLVDLVVAYAYGSTRTARASPYTFIAVGIAVVIAILQIKVSHQKTFLEWIVGKLPRCNGPASDAKHEHNTANQDNAANQHSRTEEGNTANQDNATNDDIITEERNTAEEDNTNNQDNGLYRMLQYMILVGILGASVTYQAGLVPPGGTWPDDGDGHAAGSPALRDTDMTRYRAFFYSNSASFLFSIVLTLLVVHRSTLSICSMKVSLPGMHAILVLELLSLLVAYTTGSSRSWDTSGYVLAMAITALAYIAIYVLVSLSQQSQGRDGSESPREGHTQPATA